MEFFLDHRFFLILLVIFMLLQCYYWMQRFRFHIPVKTNALGKAPVSVIICAKNEFKNLQTTLPVILNQSYPNYEVLLCDDFSTDETAKWVYHLSEKERHLRYIKPDKDLPGKKYALSFAARKAQNDWILVTDADCLPASDRWIEGIMASRKEQSSIVLGYAPFRKEKSFINQFQRYECLFTAIQYLSAARLGQTYMGVGRNMLFRKEDYIQFMASHKPKTASGDDDLFVNQLDVSKNVGICIDHPTFVYSDPKANLKDFFNQKRRHISSSIHYKRSSFIHLFFYPLSHIGFWLCTFILVASPFWAFALICLFLRMLCIFNILRGWAVHLREEDLLEGFFKHDLLFTFYYLVLAPFLFIYRKKDW